MTIDQLRGLILRALEAAKYGVSIDPDIARAIADGQSLPLEQLGFDSLAWMEFCICVELETRLELTPHDIGGMATVHDIEAWLGARLEDARLPG